MAVNLKDNLVDLIPVIASTKDAEKEKSSSEMRENLLLMLEALSDLQNLLIQIDTKKSSMNADISTIMSKHAVDNLEDVKRKVAEYEEQKRKAEEASKWGFLANIFITVASCILSLVTLNPGLMITTCVMTALEQSGGMEKIGEGIDALCGDDKLLSFFVKVAFVVALCAIAAKASGSFAQSSSKTGAQFVAATQVAGSFQELGGLHDILVYYVDQQHPEMSKEEKDRLVAQLEMIYGITLSVVLAIVGIAGSALCFKSIANDAGSWSKAIFFISLLGNGMNIFGNLASAGANTAKAKILFEEADTLKELAVAQSALQVYQQLASFDSQMIEQSNADLQKAIEQVGLINQDQAKYVEADKKLAELLAAMAV